jgi:beta-xylosidase
MENFIKKKFIIFESNNNQRDTHTLAYEALVGRDIQAIKVRGAGFMIQQYNLISLNKNHISEVTEPFQLNLNLSKSAFYSYIQFYTGRKVLMVEKKDDFSKKIKEFDNFKYQQIIMSNGNQ